MQLISMSEGDRKVFNDNYLIYGLKQEAKDEISKLCTIEDSRPGDTIFREDEMASDLIVILRGTVGVKKGREKLAEFGPSAVVGEIALVDARPRSADVVPITPVTFARFDGPMLRKHMFDNQAVGFIMLANLARVIASHVRGLNDQYEHLKGLSHDPWESVRD